MIQKHYVEIKAWVDPELHAAFKAEAAKRRTNIKAAMIAAVQAWMGGAVPMPMPTVSPAPSVRAGPHQEWHEKLDLILDHGDEKDVVGIQANLDWGAEAVSRRKPQHRRAG